MDMTDFILWLRRAIASYRFTYNNEAELQLQLELLFEREEMPMDREFRISAKDRPDFAFVTKGGGRVLIEVKIDRSIASHLRQLRRYAANPSVEAVVLLAPFSRGVPPQLMRVPIYHIPIPPNL
jgi:hypothetical protein